MRKVNNKYTTKSGEIKLPDDAANIIIRLLNNKSDYVNFTDIKFERTQSADLQR